MAHGVPGVCLRRFLLDFVAAGSPVAGNGQSPEWGGAPGAGNQRSIRAGGVGGAVDVPGLGDSGGVGMRRTVASVSAGGGGGGGGASGGDDVKPLLVRTAFFFLGWPQLFFLPW